MLASAPPIPRSPPVAAAASVPVAPAPAAAPPPPLTGQVLDRGTTRRESVRSQIWATDGTAKVLGNVEVGQVDLRGFVTIGGTLTSDRVLVRGELEVIGETVVQGAREVRGQCRTFANVSARDAGFDGIVHVGGALRVDRLLQSHGQLEVDASVRAGLFESDGRFEISGDLDAPRVRATLRGTSRVGTIRADDVQLKLPARPPILRSIGASASLDIDRIEANSVVIEGVTVQYIRADRIVVGRKCHVVRYDGTVVSCHSSSHLGPESRSPPPPGMSR